MRAPLSRPHAVPLAVLVTLVATGCGGDGGTSSDPPGQQVGDSAVIVAHTGVAPDHLVTGGGTLYWSENSATPVHRLSLSTLQDDPAAFRMGTPMNVLAVGGDLYWLDDGSDPGHSMRSWTS